MDRKTLIKFALRVLIPLIGISIIYRLSEVLFEVLPDCKYPVFIVDLWGITPSLIVIAIAMPLYLRAGKRAASTLKISLFVLTACLSVLFFQGHVFMNAGINLYPPMIILLIIFTAYSSFHLLVVNEKFAPIIKLILEEKKIRDTFLTVFSVVGFPIVFIDLYFALWWFGLGIVGGVGIRDGLNKMLVVLFLYSLLLYGTNKLTERLTKDRF